LREAEVGAVGEVKGAAGGWWRVGWGRRVHFLAVGKLGEVMWGGVYVGEVR